MIKKYIDQAKKISNTPMPALKLSNVASTGVQFVIFFGVFYFAIFEYNAPLERIRRDMIEFFLAGFSLFSGWLIFCLIVRLYSKFSKKLFSPKFGHAPFVILFIYSIMIWILFLIKLSVYGPVESWVWKYYWRHLPYAFLIFCIYFYRENKNFVIENMIDQLNLKLETNVSREIKPENTNQKESFIYLQADGGRRKILSANISHVSVNGHYLDIYYQEDGRQESLLVRKSLAEILEELPTPSFLRIHRSHIVNLDHISEITKAKRKNCVLVCNRQFSLPVSRSNLSTLLSRLEYKS